MDSPDDSKSPAECLPIELVEAILMEVPFPDIFQAIQVSRTFDLLARSPQFWRRKIQHDLQVETCKKPSDISWRNYYRAVHMSIRGWSHLAPSRILTILETRRRAHLPIRGLVEQLSSVDLAKIFVQAMLGVECPQLKDGAPIDLVLDLYELLPEQVGIPAFNEQDLEPRPLPGRVRTSNSHPVSTLGSEVWDLELDQPIDQIHDMRPIELLTIGLFLLVRWKPKRAQAIVQGSNSSFGPRTAFGPRLRPTSPNPHSVRSGSSLAPLRGRCGLNNKIQFLVQVGLGRTEEAIAQLDRLKSHNRDSILKLEKVMARALLIAIRDNHRELLSEILARAWVRNYIRPNGILDLLHEIMEEGGSIEPSTLEPLIEYLGYDVSPPD